MAGPTVRKGLFSELDERQYLIAYKTPAGQWQIDWMMGDIPCVVGLQIVPGILSFRINPEIGAAAAAGDQAACLIIERIQQMLPDIEEIETIGS